MCLFIFAFWTAYIVLTDSKFRFRFWVFKLPVNYICLNLGAGSPTSQGVLPGASGLIAGLIAVRAALFGGLHHVFYAYVFPSGGIYR